MTRPSERQTDRRRFLSWITATALSVTGAPAAFAAATGRPARRHAPGSAPSTDPKWDDTWVDRVRAARHKAVFDSPAISDGDALGMANRYLSGCRDALGTAGADVQAVIVFRHKGLPIALSDAMWDRYELAKADKLDDPSTGRLAHRNPFLHVTKDDKHAAIEPEESIESLRARGVVFLGCNLALMALASQLADRTQQKPEAVTAELRANLLPGIILQPNGVYATLRAQDAGCGFMRP